MYTVNFRKNKAKLYSSPKSFYNGNRSYNDQNGYSSGYKNNRSASKDTNGYNSNRNYSDNNSNRSFSGGSNSNRSYNGNRSYNENNGYNGNRSYTGDSSQRRQSFHSTPVTQFKDSDKKNYTQKQQSSGEKPSQKSYFKDVVEQLSVTSITDSDDVNSVKSIDNEHAIA